MWQINDNLSIKLAVIEAKSLTVNHKKQAFEQLNRCALRYRYLYKDTLIGDIEGVKSTRRLLKYPSWGMHVYSNQG